MAGSPGPDVRIRRAAFERGDPGGSGIEAGRPAPEGARPLILTVGMDAASFDALDRLRRAHFPPERNVVPAHVTLFHHLPGDEQAAIEGRVDAICARQAPFPMEVTGLRFLGRGVALELRSEPLRALRADLAAAWAPWLTPQDRQGFRPHLTVQDKASPAEARALHARLLATLVVPPITGVGLRLWRYLGGPWGEVREFPFRA